MATVSRPRDIALRILIACLFFVAACLYRFNTLDGRFGGFDDDHFVPFAYAKQMQAGEQPLRDFDGLGLQGAWPSLTYEVSALAQRWFGDNLRSEALVTVAGVGIAAALTFLAASAVSTMLWAALLTPISVFVAPTLYNYPKVLTFAAAALVMAVYARRPRVSVVVVAAALTAMAFLFRHDLSVYVGIGVVLVCLIAGKWWSRGIRDVVTYATVTIVLLAPSLIFVQRQEGLIQYFRDGLALSRREADRTDLGTWPRFALIDDTGSAVAPLTFFSVEQNGVTWLYYVMRLLPIAAFAIILTGSSEADPQVRRLVMAVAGMSAFAAPLLIRGNVAVRLGDVGPLLVVLLAFVCHEATRRRTDDSRALQAFRWGAVAVLLAGTAMSTGTVGYVGSQLGTAGIRHSWAATSSRFQYVWARLATLPDAAITEEAPVSPLDISQYLNRCTQPTDRVVMMTYEPELLPFAGRLFGAGRLSIIPDYALAPHQERALVARWRRQSVPLALVEFEEFWNTSSATVPIIREYLLERYTPVGTVAVRDDRVLRVFAERGRTASTTFGANHLPCFR